MVRPVLLRHKGIQTTMSKPMLHTSYPGLQRTMTRMISV